MIVVAIDRVARIAYLAQGFGTPLVECARVPYRSVFDVAMRVGMSWREEYREETK
jgi:hypothetical protein